MGYEPILSEYLSDDNWGSRRVLYGNIGLGGYMKNNYLENWINLKPFKTWCLQILPTIFDESMSYYECLCKMVEILNNTLSNVNLLQEAYVNFVKQSGDDYDNFIKTQQENYESFITTQQNNYDAFTSQQQDNYNKFIQQQQNQYDSFVERMEDSYNTLKNFVDNYFENLDVQNEINNKLDAMAESGELNEIMQPYFTQLQNQVSSLQSQINNLQKGGTEQSSEIVAARYDEPLLKDTVFQAFNSTMYGYDVNNYFEILDYYPSIFLEI